MTLKETLKEALKVGEPVPGHPGLGVVVWIRGDEFLTTLTTHRMRLGGIVREVKLA